MSDTMLLGILRCPIEPGDQIAVMQLISAAQRAADRVEELERHLRMRDCGQCGNLYTGSCGDDCELPPLVL